jgi:hypothetical protein
MIVGIQGSRNFDDYTIFLRGMGVALRSLPEGDKEFTVLSAGPTNINAFGQEFSNINERSLKAYGIKIRFRKVPPKWLEDNVKTLGYLLYFSKPKETLPSIVDKAEAKDIEVGIYRY